MPVRFLLLFIRVVAQQQQAALGKIHPRRDVFQFDVRKFMHQVVALPR
jgi:hypothetical protein